MPVNSKEYAFTQENVNGAPDTIGVYALLASNKGVLYYGRAMGDGVTIRSRLKAHLAGKGDPVAARTAFYKRETCSNPEAREKELLRAFEAQYGHLPMGNQRIG